ncbi:MAG TPA: DUF255 domain-containing protein [Steroidobacteraceae bacterium]|nr:DUF255 domain-containing protein [Steroidobacteraceae bacterium]
MRLQEVFFSLLIGLSLFNANAATPIAWQTTWSDALFAKAGQEYRFVILDLHAVWCHWCHVMDETTYVDSQVQRLIAKKYVAVSVDADSDPDLMARYGNWGWPATIVLAADGTEIVKRRGYIPPEQMTSLLQAIIDDPSPGPSVQPVVAINAGNGPLTAQSKKALLKSYDEFYDSDNGGWGRIHKYIDAAALEYAYLQADADRAEIKSTGVARARKTLDNNLLLIDPVWGGVYQYSDELDWRSPHFEKLLSYQTSDLRLYAEAYARWGDPRYLSAANSLFDYIDKFLTAPDGGFYVSQDADVSHDLTGHDFYKLDAAARRKLGAPKIDTHCYARETGWAIRALTKLYDVTGNVRALESAQRAARWAVASRSLPGGGFRHDEQDRGGPFLDDNVSMSGAFLALYRSTGEREWLRRAMDTLAFIDSNLHHSTAGFIAAPVATKTRGVFGQAVRLADQNAELVRIANLTHRYSGNKKFLAVAKHGMKYLAAYANAEDEQLLPEILLADHELVAAPIHIAIVGGKQDPAAQALHAAALRYPADYLQVDWLDRAEGELPNPEIQYPQLKRAAAFACVDGACSSPVFDPEKVAVAVRSALTR